MTVNILVVKWLQLTVLWSCLVQEASLTHLHSIGVFNKSIIPDDRFTASSTYNHTQFKPYYARLNGKGGGWKPKYRDNSSDYLQIDLGAVFVIRAVATQGHYYYCEWTREYKISTSIDNKRWTVYQSGGKVKLFPGNTDPYAIKTNILDKPVDGKFIRFIPTKYYRWKSIRVEVYGLKKLGKIEDIRLTGGWTPNQGYVEVNIGGKWSKIYAENWTTREARLACKMLGMTGKASPWPSPIIGALPTIMYLGTGSCHGNETSLSQCDSGGLAQRSSTFYIRGVVCGRPTVLAQGKNKTHFVTKKISDWLVHLYLPRSVYINRVTFNHSCPSGSQHYVRLNVSLYDAHFGKSIQCKFTMDHEQAAKCELEFKVNVVRIRSSDKNGTLMLCGQPHISAFDNFTNLHGVLYEVWDKYTTFNKSSILRFSEVFNGPSSISSVSPSFSINAFSGTSNYSLREEGYIAVSTSGLYFIAASCDDECEIWLRRAEESILDDKLEADHELLIKIESPTYPDRYKLSRSQYKFRKFSKCHLYHMEVYVIQRIKNDYLTVVFKLSNEQGMPLFPSEFLYWMRPGFRVLHFNVTNNISTKVTLGEELTLEAVYKFCCKGPRCPSCPLVIQLHAFGRRMTINKALEMSCVEHSIIQKLWADVQPGNHSIDIWYHFFDDLIHWQGTRPIVRSIQVSDSTRLHCAFDNDICHGWRMSSNDSQSCRWSLLVSEKSIGKSMHRGGYMAIMTPGMSTLESPSMTWNSAYEHIILCVEFSFLLPSNTTSRLEVFMKTALSQKLIWALRGEQGDMWTKARIPISTKRDFQISFRGYSKTNGSISVAIKDVQVNSRSCSLRPAHAEPGFQCKVTEYKCRNGQCINKHLRCHGIHGDCQDDSDEDGCICRSDRFICTNQQCIDHTQLCDGQKDCRDGEDEYHCDVGGTCTEYQCLDGKCSVCGQQMSCEEKLHQQFCDFSFYKETSKNKTCQMQVPRGVCDFNDDLCGFQHDANGTLFWVFFKPADHQTIKHNFPKRDTTSMTEQENYILLKPNKSNQSGYGRLVKSWNITVPACLQFWYFIPVTADTRLEIVVRMASRTNPLWSTSTSTAGDWAFGQVQLPGNSTGQIIITGYVSKHFVAIDDLGFVQGRCTTVYYQRNPSCYSDQNGACDWNMPNQTIYFNAGGWKCFRFWFYSGNKYFERKLAVEFQSENGTTEEWSHRRATDQWTFIQLPIPGNQVQIKITRQTDTPNAVLSINGSSFSKEPCLKIPAHQECYEHKTLSYSDRREDTIIKDKAFNGCDDHLSKTAWYRVVDSAGRQIANSCIKRKSSCSTENMGWINGLFPSVKDGVVERQLCFSSGDMCCDKETTVKIRNCKEYFVYLFPKDAPTCPFKYCTVYKQEWGDNRIGVSDRSVIPDDRFTASSNFSRFYKPQYARLNWKGNGWGPKTRNDSSDYLQIDLGAVYIIRAVATQGHPVWHIWTTQYMISTSSDNMNWTMYQSGGKAKLFPGNKDRKSVVKNTLDDTRTLGRFIRFIPTKYKRWKSLRVEVYGYRKEQEGLNQDTRSEWEGWVKRGDEIKVQWEVLDEYSYEKAAKSLKTSNRSQVDNLTQDHGTDIGFSLGLSNHSVNVEINETLEEMTLCLWTSINSSSSVIISINYAKEKKEKKVIALLEIDTMTSNRTRDWMHICVTWMSNFGVWQTYIDGVGIRHGTGVLDRSELHRDHTISVTFESQDQKTKVKYNRLNIWKTVLSKQYILYMSYDNCGAEIGNLIGWKDYLKLLPRGSSGFGIYNSTCRGKQGNVLSLVGASGAPSSLARIESPQYERSSESPGRCLKFKYKLWGSGARALIIYQEFDNKEYSKRRIWMVRDSDDSRWRDGQVTLTAVTAYKLAIEGNVTSTPGLMSIGALHTTEGYCDHIIPPSASQACNEILNNNTGYIVSPYYPGYYDNNVECTWTIKAEKNHVIRMEFIAFEMEWSPRCSADFVEVHDVFDGEVTQSTFRINRYCGTRYRQIIESQSETLKIRFKSNDNVTQSGFKAYYQIIKGAEDDECIQDCPLSCTCRKETNGGGIIITSNQLKTIPDRLPKNTKACLFSGSQIYQVQSNAFFKLSRLSMIDLSFNRIFVIEDKAFASLPSLKTLDLGENLISIVQMGAFSGLPSLIALSLRSNQLKSLHRATFENTTNLTYLYLQDNQVKGIPSGMFRNQKTLEILFLHQNKIERIDKSSFEGLENLRKLSLRNNSITEHNIQKDAFQNLKKLKYLSTDSFIMCCYATKSVPNLDCESPGNEFSSCDDMLKSVLVKVCIWVEGVIATFANLAVLAWWIYVSKRRNRSKRKINSVQSLLFCHLALADLLMGIYLIIIGSYDQSWKGEYFLYDVEWRAGVGCKLAGAIATLSSEVSVMILVAITADRINTIVFQLSGRRTNLKVAHVLCLFIWVIGFLMSFTPLLATSYFDDKESGFSFYGRSTVCLPLHLSTDRPAGWEYSVALFIAFNGAAFLFILVGYVAIFIKVRESARNVRSSSSSESAVGKRVIFVIMTDFFCWMPVMILGLLSLVHDFNDPSVYIWVAVFVLPVNSAINPVLYTFSSSQTINSMKSIRKELLSDKDKRKICPGDIKDTDLPGRQKAKQSGQTNSSFTLQRINLEITGNEAEMNEPAESPKEEILMTELQVVLEADGDQRKTTFMELVIKENTKL